MSTKHPDSAYHAATALEVLLATDLVQVIGSLIHKFRLESGARGIYFQDRGSRGIVPAVDVRRRRIRGAAVGAA